MTDSKRLIVLKALTSLLETIDNTPPENPPDGWAADYQHNLTNRVSRGVPVLGANTPLPWVNILEFPQIDQDSQWAGTDTSKRYKHQWDLVIQGWAKAPTGTDADMNPTDPCYLLLADVQKCLAQIMDMGTGGAPGTYYMLRNANGGKDLITSFTMTPGLVRPVEESSSTPCFYLRVRVGVAEKVSDPYALA